MCKAIEEMRNEAAAQAKWEQKVENALELLSMGLGTLEQIAQATHLTLEEVQELAKEVQKPV